jgi:hypothetical protein
MKWGHYNNLGNPEEEMLQLVLHQIAKDEISVVYHNDEYGAALNGFFRPGGGAGGDPVFDIEHIPEAGGYGSFDAYCEMEPVGHVIFPAERVVNTLEEIFKAYAVEFPEERHVVENILAKFPEYRERLKT